MRALLAGNADFFLLPLAFARRLEQTEHRLGNIRVANEYPLDRARLERARSPREREIGRIGIDHMSPRIRDREAVKSMIGDAAPDRIVGGAIGKPDDTGGEGEQVEQTNHREQRKQPEDIWLSLRPARRD